MPIRAAILFGTAFCMLVMMIATPFASLAQRTRGASHDLTDPAALGEMVAVHDQRLGDITQDVKEIRQTIKELRLDERLTKIEDSTRSMEASWERIVRLFFTAVGGVMVAILTRAWKIRANPKV